jgi:hypothetical protein
MLEELPLTFWDRLFEKYLTLADLISLSEVNRKLYLIAHEIISFKKITSSKPSLNRLVYNMDQVKAWKNISFIRNMTLNRNRKLINHYTFHTWEKFSNVLFSISTNGEPPPQNLVDRIFFLSLEGKKEIPIGIPHLYIKKNQHFYSPKLDKRTKTFTLYRSYIFNMNNFNFLEKLEINNCNIYVSLPNVTTVIVTNSTLNQRKPLTGVKNLVLRHCNYIEDYTIFGKIENLTINSIQVTNINFIGEGCRSLNLSRSIRIQDLSHLSRISSLQELDISYCCHITDISRLRVSKIKAEGCERIAYTRKFKKDGCYYIKHDSQE